MSITTLKRIRMLSLAIGCGCIVLIMLIFPDSPWPRDLLWSIGVAALVFTLVVNYLLRRGERARQRDQDGG